MGLVIFHGVYHGSNYDLRGFFKIFFLTTEQANLNIWLHLCHMSYLSSIAKWLPLVKDPSGKCFTVLVPWKSVSNNVWCVCIPFTFNFTEIHTLYIYTTFLFPQICLTNMRVYSDEEIFTAELCHIKHTKVEKFAWHNLLGDCYWEYLNIKRTQNGDPSKKWKVWNKIACSFQGFTGSHSG